MYTDDFFESFIEGLEQPDLTWENIMYLDQLIESSTIQQHKKNFFQNQVNINMSKEKYTEILWYVKSNQPNLQQLDYLPGATKLTKYINDLIKTKR